MKNILFMLLILLSLNTQSQNVDLQKSLNVVFADLQKNWTDEMLKTYKNYQEDEAPFRIGTVVQRFICTTAKIPGTDPTNYLELLKSFSNLNVIHEPDALCLTALFFHRNLNSKPLEIQAEIENIINYRKKKIRV